MKIDMQDLQAKSDQMNAVDFVKPMLFKITKVDYFPKKEQPIHIHLEGCDGRPYKPCKGMLRGLVGVLGDEPASWGNRLIELYCDPSVKWAGKDVGGIRISGLGGISQPHVFPVTLNRSQRVMHAFRVLDNSQEAKREFVITHWEADINEAETNEAIDAIVQTVKKEFGMDCLMQLQDAVKTARSKFAEPQE